MQTFALLFNVCYIKIVKTITIRRHLMVNRITIKEIARLAGVNISTVSRALNPETASKISTVQREKIIELCNKYNYRPRVVPKGYATGKSYRVGLILGAIASDLANPLYALYIRGMCSELQHNGYTLSVLWAEEEPEKRDEVVRNFLMSEIADGYVVGAPLLAPQTIETLNESGRPILSFRSGRGQIRDDFSFLQLDPEEAFRKIWQVMPQALRENIVFFGPESENSRNKVAAILNCTEAPVISQTLLYGFESSESAFPHDYAWASQNFRRYEKEMLKAKLIWCTSDLVALAVCDELSRCGLQVGKDIFVLGYDNIEKNKNYPGKEKFLSTVDPHWEEAGRTSAGLILDALRTPAKNKLPPEIVIKGSYVCRKSFPFE